MLFRSQRSLESRSSVHLVDVTVPPKAPDHFFVHPLAAIDDGAEIGKGTRIWHFSHVLKNSRLGEYCFIAAGAVVTKDVPPFALMAGVPARRIGWVGHSGERLGKDLVCPREGRRYRLAGPDRLEEIPSKEKETVA